MLVPLTLLTLLVASILLIVAVSFFSPLVAVVLVLIGFALSERFIIG